jgi:hypothetical protein
MNIFEKLETKNCIEYIVSAFWQWLSLLFSWKNVILLHFIRNEISLLVVVIVAPAPKFSMKVDNNKDKRLPYVRILIFLT